VDGFSATDQLHGAFLLMIKCEHGCKTHTDENGELGHRWVDASGNHIRLTPRNLRAWAAAMVGGVVFKSSYTYMTL